MYYRFSFDEGIVSVSQCLINRLDFFVWLGATAHVNGFLEDVFSIRGNDLLRVGYAHDFLPVMVDAFGFQLIANGIHQRISKQTKIQMFQRVGIVVFMINGT